MFITQKRVIPRWKQWTPLATHQFRLRNVIQIIGMNIGTEDLEGKICGTSVDNDSIPAVSYYFTLHLTAMSAPFYTSEKLDTNCPQWKEIDTCMWENSGVFGGIQGFVLRIWCNCAGNAWDKVLTVWGIHLTGLVHLGPCLSVGKLSYTPNTIIFLMPGGYYTNPGNIKDVSKVRVTSVGVPKDDVHLSYSVSMLHKLSSVQHAKVQKAVASEALKVKISTGDYLTAENRGSAMLRKLLNKNRPKTNHLDLVKLKESVEIARFRVKTLQEERSRMLARVASAQGRLEAKADKNQLQESRTMEKYRLLQREVQVHRQWLVGHVQQREAQLHAKALLNFRIKQLISELQFIYPVDEIRDNKFTICGVHLPDSENLIGCDELQVAVGLGFVAHTVQMISCLLQVPLRYPVIHVGSRSRIVDLISDKMPDSEREFPLFCKGKDKLQFNYAVYLLNKNVASLRWLCGMPTPDLRCTLPNLAALLRLSGTQLPAGTPLRSPTSSTVDFTSSSFSISSPVPTHLPPRPFTHRHRVSESALDEESAQTGLANSIVNADFRMPETTNSLTSNFSYSLDKGLNQIEELKRKSDWLETDKPSSGAPIGGSESSLATCLVRDDPAKLCLAEDASTSTFLKNWEADKNVVLSDDDSDHNATGIFSEKTICSLEAEHNMRDHEKDMSRRKDSDGVSVGLEASDSNTFFVKEISGQDDGTCVAENVASIVEETNVETATGDLLLDNVTNRTEALANQTTSFNMFRSRFRNSLGSTR